MTIFYIKKITSLNPNRYKFITFAKANKLYGEYVMNVLRHSEEIKIKTFNEWCLTEL